MIRPLMTAALLLPVTLAAQDTTAIKSALLNADRAAARNAAEFTAALDDNATVLLADRNVLHGRAQFASALNALFNADKTPAWTPLHAVVSRDATLGCTTGTLRLTGAAADKPATGRYAACWRRAGAAWRMIAYSRAEAPAAVRALPDSIANAPASAQFAMDGAVRDVARTAARAMADADRAFAKFSADSGGPGGAFAKWIAADGMMLGARAVPVRGGEQARAAFAGFPSTGRFEWGPIDSLTVASSDGSLGFTVG